MKKILSLVLALMLLALCPAVAETATATQTLTSPNGDYSFDVPQDYISLDAELMMGLLTAPEMQELIARVMGMADASQLTMYFEAAKANNMMIVYTADWSGNLNVQAVQTPLTMDLLVMMKADMDAAMIEQYTMLGFAEENIQMMDIQEIAGRKWYGVKMEMAGMPMLSMITMENGMQYTVTFSQIDEEMVYAILASFKTAVAAAEE